MRVCVRACVRVRARACVCVCVRALRVRVRVNGRMVRGSFELFERKWERKTEEELEQNRPAGRCFGVNVPLRHLTSSQSTKSENAVFPPFFSLLLTSSNWANTVRLVASTNMNCIVPRHILTV